MVLHIFRKGLIGCFQYQNSVAPPPPIVVNRHLAGKFFNNGETESTLTLAYLVDHHQIPHDPTETFSYKVFRKIPAISHLHLG